MSSKLKRRIVTVVIAGLGAALFLVLHLPLPMLFGPMAACLVAALLGVELANLGVLSILARTVIGVAVGTAITPAFFAELPQMGVSLLFIPLYVLAIAAIGLPLFQKVYGFDFKTAYYCSMPGGLQDMVVFAQEAGANLRTVSLVHATRLLIFVTLVPFLISHTLGATLDGAVGVATRDLPWHEMVLMAIAAIGGWKIAEHVGLFGATVLGPLIVSAIFSMTGLIHYRPPSEALMTAQYFIGLGIGVSYVGVTFVELRRIVLAGVGFVALLLALAYVFSHLVVSLGIAPGIDAFLAFAPGGQAEMAMLAIITGGDLAYVVAHHLTRVILVITCAPIIERWVRARQGKDGQ